MSLSREITGWDGRIRTYGTLYQKQLPYHLATSQQRGGEYDEGAGCSSPEMGKLAIHFAFVVSGKNKGLNAERIGLC